LGGGLIGRKSAGNVRGELFSYADCCNFGKFIGIDALMAMRIPSTLLKPAVLLLLGASAVFGSKANAVTTFNWTSLVNGISGTGQFTIDQDQSALVPLTSYLITGLSGTFNGETINQLLGTATLEGNNNLYYYNTFNLFGVDFSGVSFGTSSGNFYNIFFSGGGAGAANNYTFSPTLASNSRIGGSFTSSATLAAVPGPLPILGLPAVLFYSRKLKKRIKASREASGAALI
jgi:hypothetical protein